MINHIIRILKLALYVETSNLFIFPRYEFSLVIYGLSCKRVDTSLRILISVLLNIMRDLSPDIVLFIVMVQ